MEMRMYCVYDFKAEAPVNRIFQCHGTDAEASRLFSALVMSPNSGMVHDHPGDFGLLCVGVMDFDTLVFKGHPGCRANPVITGEACVRAVERARADKSISQGEEPGLAVV